MALDYARNWESVLDYFFQVLEGVLNQIFYVLKSFLFMISFIYPFLYCLSFPYYDREEGVQQKHHIVFQGADIKVDWGRLFFIELVFE